MIHMYKNKYIVMKFLSFVAMKKKKNDFCRNPTLAKCGGEAQHLEKLEVWSLPGLPNV